MKYLIPLSMLIVVVAVSCTSKSNNVGGYWPGANAVYIGGIPVGIVPSSVPTASNPCVAGAFLGIGQNGSVTCLPGIQLGAQCPPGTGTGAFPCSVMSGINGSSVPTCVQQNYNFVGTGSPVNTQTCYCAGDKWFDGLTGFTYECIGAGNPVTSFWRLTGSAGSPTATASPTPSPSPTSTGTPGPTPTPAPWTFVIGSSVHNSGGVGTATPAATAGLMQVANPTPTVGNVMIMEVGMIGAPTALATPVVTSITGGCGTITWTKVGAKHNANTGSTYVDNEIWCGVCSATPNNLISVNLSQNLMNGVINTAQYTGGTCTVDATAVGNSGTGSPMTSGPLTTVTAGDGVFSGIEYGAGFTGLVIGSPNGGFTQRNNDDSAGLMVSALYDNLSGSIAAYTESGATQTGTTNYARIMTDLLGTNPSPTVAPTPTPTPGPSGVATPAPPPGALDPVAFCGADKTGATNAINCFQSALNANNVYVSTTGTYLINGTGQSGLVMPSNRTFQCAPGVTLKTTRKDTFNSGLIYTNGSSAWNIIGCNFQGPWVPADGAGNNNSNLIEIYNNSANWLIEAATFTGTEGDAAIHIQNGTGTVGNTPSSGIIQFNNFNRGAHYGVAVVDGTGITVKFNQFVDASCCAESNSASSNNTNNLYTNNSSTLVQNDGFGQIFLTGGVAGGANYSSDTVSNNTLLGTAGTNINVIQTCSGTCVPAVYTGNTCNAGNHCVVQ